MGRKRLIVGQSEWVIEDDAVNVVTDKIRDAMENKKAAELTLLDAAGRPVTVYLNGNTVQTAVVDLDMGPRPTEIS